MAETFIGIGRDLVQAGRSLAKARAFTFVCVVSLGIGMAPVIAIPYATRILTTPPPGLNTGALVEIVTTSAGPRSATDDWSYPDFLDLRDADTGVSMTGWAQRAADVTLEPSGEVKPVQTMYVSADYFRTIGVALGRGPGFLETTDPVVILGYGFWQNRLGADPDIVGNTLTLDGVRHLVVGIAPYSFEGHLGFQEAQLFVPLERHPLLLGANSLRADRGKEWVRIHGRLSPGVGIRHASAAVSARTSQLATEYPATNEHKAGVVEAYHPMGSLEGADLPIIFTVWLTIAAMSLLVVCLNISGMVQVRSAMRERELSIRQAIGASRGRLIQHLLAEAVVLAALGAGLASLVLFNTPPLVSWLLGEPIPVSWQEALSVDFSMIAICVGLCLATSLLFGWLPASRFSRPVIITVLKDDACGGGIRAGRVHRRTAALQVAVAVPFLVISAISIDRVRSTASADLGFASDLVYAAPLGLDAVADENAGARIRRVRDTLETASGVTAVTLADGLPLDFRYRLTRVALQTDANAAPRFVSVQVTRVGDGYLDTMGIPLLRGRGFTVDDRPGAELVAIVSRALADHLFPNAEGSEVIGAKLAFEAEQKTQQILTVVGVTGDFPTSQMSTERAQLLLPLAQHPAPGLFLIARSAPGEQPKKLTTALENAVRELNVTFNRTLTTSEGAGYSSIVTGVSLRQNSLDDFINQSAFAGITSGVLLMLASLGIYGVVGLMVAARTREIAVRVALGASRRRLLGMILFDVVKLVLPGVAVGLLISIAFIRLNGDGLGIPLSNLEPLAYVAGAAIAILVAVVAGLAPARRAASVQPMVAMRSE